MIDKIKPNLSRLELMRIRQQYYDTFEEVLEAERLQLDYQNFRRVIIKVPPRFLEKLLKKYKSENPRIIAVILSDSHVACGVEDKTFPRDYKGKEILGYRREYNGLKIASLDRNFENNLEFIKEYMAQELEEKVILINAEKNTAILTALTNQHSI